MQDNFLLFLGKVLSHAAYLIVLLKRVHHRRLFLFFLTKSKSEPIAERLAAADLQVQLGPRSNKNKIKIKIWTQRPSAPRFHSLRRRRKCIFPLPPLWPCLDGNELKLAPDQGQQRRRKTVKTQDQVRQKLLQQWAEGMVRGGAASVRRMKSRAPRSCVVNDNACAAKRRNSARFR